MTEREQFLGQIERLVSSHALHGSESLCKLLRYLAKNAVEHPGSTLKEYQDSTVRVQAGRLRVKLAEYYASNGSEDTIVVELPKGAYALSFHHGGATGARTHGPRREIERDEGFERSSSRRWMIAAGALAVLLASAVAAIVVLLVARNTAEVGAAGHEDTAPAAFHVFWKRFISGPEEPWVIFSNAAFIGRPETGMRYYEAARDSRLDHVFGLLHHRIRLKRGSLFSLDDAKNNNLIFIGSPSENLTLLEIPGTQEFVFQRVVSGRRKGDLEIVNVHPQPGESKQFLATPSGEPLTEDYAVVALVRGLNPAQSVLILAGTTTIGTQAAVEYVCRQDSIEKLLLRLSVSDAGELKPYEAVLQVKVTRGVPVETQLVALRKGAS